MRFVAASLLVHAIVLLLLAGDARVPAPSPVQLANLAPVAAPITVDVIQLGGGGGAGEPAAPSTPVREARAARIGSTRADAWRSVSIRTESAGDGGAGDGSGGGTGGRGRGRGIGLGDGAGVAVAHGIPALPLPVPPPPSKARPARLVWPTRDLEVTSESDLFIARVTVDSDGSVAGVRMVKTRPGTKGEHAASAIWTFRYLPALDDAGAPIASTFEQRFQVR